MTGVLSKAQTYSTFRYMFPLLFGFVLLFAFAHSWHRSNPPDQNFQLASQFRRMQNLSDDAFRNLPPTYRSASSSCVPVAQRNKTSPGATMDILIGMKKARQVARGGYEKVQPGSGPVSFVGLFVTVLSKLQHKRSAFGSVGELGVHHGRFTIVLFSTARRTEKLVAADIFMQQEKNQDGSGKGDLRRFMAALEYVGILKDDLDVLHVGGTLELPFDWYKRQEFEPFRMVSIDAGHTAELTFNDLEVTACSTMKGGIIILDDFLHPHWTGVTEGWYRYLRDGHDKLYPILLCDRKLFVTNDPEAHKAYYKGLVEHKRVGKFVLQSAERWGGSKSLEMNGVHYLLCDTAGHDDKHVREIWSDLVY